MNDKTRIFLRYWLPLCLYVGCIFFLSSLSSFPYRLVAVFSDKVLHFGEYAILALLAFRAIRSVNRQLPVWVTFAITLLGVAFLGGADELYQRLIPFRDSSWFDFLADLSGGLAGSLTYLVLQGLLSRRAGSED
jgi:VanZ family protein